MPPLVNWYSAKIVLVLVGVSAIVRTAAVIGSTKTATSLTNDSLPLTIITGFSSPKFQSRTIDVNLRSTTNVASLNATNTTNMERPSTCSSVRRRREWRSLPAKDKKAYIRAVQCLQSLKPIAKIRGSRSRFDDFQGLHIQLMEQVHLVGQFLPWHRWFMTVYERTLINECNYVGAQPYWDWSLDIKSFPKSPVFDKILGFGSLVQNSRGPVPDGPFASYRLIFGTGPPRNITEHYLERAFDPTMVQYLTKSKVKSVLGQPNFERFRLELEGTPVATTIKTHDGGHAAVGGEMADQWSSPGDPLFFLHHSNLDRIWWEWQKLDPVRRLKEISGPTTSDPPYHEVTLDYLLPMGHLASPRAIRDVMNIEKHLCYTYV